MVLIIGLAALTGLLLIGVVCLVCRMRMRRGSAKKPIKKDFNPLYGVEDDKNPQSKSFDYNY